MERGHGTRVSAMLPPAASLGDLRHAVDARFDNAWRANIVVVDDDEANVRLLERAFQRAGYERFHGFTDPVIALESIPRIDPDLVLLDLEMPGLGGLDLLRAVRSGTPPDTYLPILVITGNQDGATRRLALDQGATDFLTKPFDLDELRLRSRNLIEGRLMHSALAMRVDALGAALAEREEALERTQHEQAQMSASLARAAGLSVPEEIAAALCADLASVTRARYVTLLLFESPERAMSYVAHGRRSDADVGYAIPVARSRELWQRASAGPWVEADLLGRARGSDAAQLWAAGWRSALYAPLRFEDELLGLLSVGTTKRRTADTLARDLPSVVRYATVAGALLGRALALRRQAVDARRSIESIIERAAFMPVAQPILSLVDKQVVGYEALTRFSTGARPDQLFAQAARLGLGPRLELATMEAAVRMADQLPAGAWLSVNVSPEVVLSRGPLIEVLSRCSRQLVVEITEHAPVDDYAALRAAARALGDARVAVDDAGAGFASMQHVVELQPDIVKLDISLVRGVDADPVRQGLVAGMVHFAGRTGIHLIGEGIETEAELRTLAGLGVHLGQGYLLGRPQAIAPS